MKLFLQKNAKFLSAGGSAPDPPNSPPIANFWLRAWLCNSYNLTLIRSRVHNLFINAGRH